MRLSDRLSHSVRCLPRPRVAVATAVALLALVAGPGVGSALAAPTFTLAGPAAVTEGQDSVFTVTCSPAAECNNATVTFATSPGTATSPDFTAQSGQLTFDGTGAVTAGGGVLTVPTIDDALNENAEQFTGALSNPSSGSVAGSPATATINDNDPLPSLSVNDAGAGEGTNNIFTVTLNPVSGRTVTVDLFSQSGTAQLNSDFGGPSPSTLTFFPGETSKQVSVAHFCDNFGENTEGYTANLTNAPNATFSRSQGFGSIFDTNCGSSTDLLMIKEESADPVQVGTELRYTLRVHNLGPATAFNVTVTDPLPAGMQFVSVNTTQGNCSPPPQNSTTVVCNLGTVNSGAIPFIDLRVRPTLDTVSENRASVNSSTSDFNPGNNAATTSTRSFAAGSTPPPPVDNPTEDLTAPIANLGGARRCELVFDRECLIEVTSSENGEVLAGGRIIAVGRAQSSAAFFFRRVRRKVEAFQQQELSLRVGSRARRLVRRTLRRGGRVRARIRIVVRDQNGNARVRRRTLPIAG